MNGDRGTERNGTERNGTERNGTVTKEDGKNAMDNAIVKLKLANLIFSGQCKNVAIITHARPDADAICSMKIAARLTRYISPDAVVHKFADLKDQADFEKYEMFFEHHRAEVNPEKPFEKYDMAVVVDCARKERMGKYQEIFEKAKHSINIDHHVNDKFAEWNIVKEDASSTCEIMYDIMKERKIPVTNSTAALIYGGILTDTNHFSNNTTKHTHEVIADIYDKASPEIVADKLCDRSAESAKVFRACDMAFLYDGRLVAGTVHKHDLLNCEAQPRDILGIPDQLLGINGAKMSLTFIEEEAGGWKVSCRAVHTHSIVDIVKFMKGGYSSQQIGAFNTDYNPLIVMEKLKPLLDMQLCEASVAKEFNPFSEGDKERPQWHRKGILRLPQLVAHGKEEKDNIASHHLWVMGANQ
jgi:phosphoesterase RecJ-like protein